jgi:Tat protein secretion system quality control protein TatD with DNase activity
MGIRLADHYPMIVATAGVHPHDAAGDRETFHHLEQLRGIQKL